MKLQLGEIVTEFLTNMICRVKDSQKKDVRRGVKGSYRIAINAAH